MILMKVFLHVSFNHEKQGGVKKIEDILAGTIPYALALAEIT